MLRKRLYISLINLVIVSHYYIIASVDSTVAVIESTQDASSSFITGDIVTAQFMGFTADLSPLAPSHPRKAERDLQRTKLQYIVYEAGKIRTQQMISLVEQYNRIRHVKDLRKAMDSTLYKLGIKTQSIVIFKQIVDLVIDDAIHLFIEKNMGVILGIPHFEFSIKEIMLLKTLLNKIICISTNGYKNHHNTVLGDLGALLCCMFDGEPADYNALIKDKFQLPIPASTMELTSTLEGINLQEGIWHRPDLGFPIDGNMFIPFFYNGGHLSIYGILRSHQAGLSLLGAPDYTSAQFLSVHGGIFRGKIFKMYRHDMNHAKDKMHGKNPRAIEYILMHAISEPVCLEDYCMIIFSFFLSYESILDAKYTSVTQLFEEQLVKENGGKLVFNLHSSHSSDMIILLRLLGFSFGDMIDSHIDIQANRLDEQITVKRRSTTDGRIWISENPEIIRIVSNIWQALGARFDQRFPLAYQMLPRPTS